jgi:hypothetical protein
MRLPEQAEVVVIAKKCAVDMDGRELIEDLGLLSKRMRALRKSSCDGSLSD